MSRAPRTHTHTDTSGTPEPQTPYPFYAGGKRLRPAGRRAGGRAGGESEGGGGFSRVWSGARGAGVCTKAASNAAANKIRHAHIAALVNNL